MLELKFIFSEDRSISTKAWPEIYKIWWFICVFTIIWINQDHSNLISSSVFKSVEIAWEEKHNHGVNKYRNITFWPIFLKKVTMLWCRMWFDDLHQLYLASAQPLKHTAYQEGKLTKLKLAKCANNLLITPQNRSSIRNHFVPHNSYEIWFLICGKRFLVFLLLWFIMAAVLTRMQ